MLRKTLKHEKIPHAPELAELIYENDILSKAICRVNMIPMKIPTFFTEIEKNSYRAAKDSRQSMKP